MLFLRKHIIKSFVCKTLDVGLFNIRCVSSRLEIRIQRIKTELYFLVSAICLTRSCMVLMNWTEEFNDLHFSFFFFLFILIARNTMSPESESHCFYLIKLLIRQSLKLTCQFITCQWNRIGLKYIMYLYSYNLWFVPIKINNRVEVEYSFLSSYSNLVMAVIVEKNYFTS